jgi:hypothetical protein
MVEAAPEKRLKILVGVNRGDEGVGVPVAVYLVFPILAFLYLQQMDMLSKSIEDDIKCRLYQL